MHPPVAPAPAPASPVAPAPASLGAAAAAGDRCAACGSVMAPDQRYCLECGERRGQARFNPRPSSATAVTTTTRVGPRRPPRLSGSTTLIAGVGTLLLAMGIGVLIGRTGSSPNIPANSKVQVVQLGGSGSASTASTPSSSGASSSGGSKKNGKSKSGGKKAKALNTNSVSAANATQTVKSLPPPTVTVGQSGHGPGYTNGHFTGKFFGP